MSQPSAGLSNSSSMVGDIFGKSWSSSKSTTGIGIGIVEKNPNLFGDLVGSALGGGKGSSSGNVPLKNVASTGAKSSYSIGNSAPKTNAPIKNSESGSSENLGSFHTNSNKNGNLGGPSMKSETSTGSKDPFGSLLDFGIKKQQPVNPNASVGSKKGGGDYSFGSSQNSAKSSTDTKGSSGFSEPNFDNFGAFEIPVQDFSSQKQPPPKSPSIDPLDMLFPSSSVPAGSNGSGYQSQMFSDVDDWGVGSEFGGNDDVGSTTELDGLPPPPSGVTASSAKNKGLDSQKQGQHADAIKYLSWAVILLEKAGDSAAIIEVLSCRASCYKEVGEYKKAIADCSKVLEQDGVNISVLLQRALLYESTEKYKLGAEDLRTVLKIDPANRLAKSTIHRLVKLAD
ncbi:hypothetical protein GIB67_017128 [Kingdonia uniflora]|nr:hypothetical protein GIB67_017128 [Kingdonia uniflora]